MRSILEVSSERLQRAKQPDHACMGRAVYLNIDRANAHSSKKAKLFEMGALRMSMLAVPLKISSLTMLAWGRLFILILIGRMPTHRKKQKKETTMTDQLHTIPITDAIQNAGECPFCYIEKHAEKRILDFVLGSSSSYMEADIREMTDKAGFCRNHFKKMADYGNALGSAWILKTHYKKMIDEMDDVIASFSPAKKKSSPFSSLLKKGDSHPVSNKSLVEKSKPFAPDKQPTRKQSTQNSISNWCKEKESSCFICDSLQKTCQAYFGTFFSLYKKEASFREAVLNGQGFCLTHFGELCDAADHFLSGAQLLDFYDTILPLEKENLSRVYEDISWFIEKYDYRNKDADWKNSKDAIPRGMQKLKGIW